MKLSSSVEPHPLPWAPPHPSLSESSQCDKECSCRLWREGGREGGNGRKKEGEGGRVSESIKRMIE